MAGKAGKSGRKSYGFESMLEAGMKRCLPLFWRNMEVMLKSDKPGDKRFAMDQLNKLNSRMIPQKLAGVPGEPLVIKWES